MPAALAEIVPLSKGGAEVVEAMSEKYTELGNPYTLSLAAYTQPHAGAAR